MKASEVHSYNDLPLFLNANLVAQVLGVSISTAIAIYGYLLRIEDRQTYQCLASYSKIGKVIGRSINTVRKYIAELEDRSLIRTERTTIITQDGRKQNGCLRYTILPIQHAVDLLLERQQREAEPVMEQ